MDDPIRTIIVEAVPNSNFLVDIVHALFARGENQLIALRDIIQARKSQDDAHGPTENRSNMLESEWLKLIFTAMISEGDFRTRMVQVSAVALAAIEAHDGRTQNQDNSPGV